MENTLIVVVVIGLAAVLLFVFPLMSLSERNDDISQLALQTVTNDLVDKVRTTGKLTQSDWTQFISSASSGGLIVEPEITLQILDENPGVKTTQTEITKIGENTYYVLYTAQVEDELAKNNQIVLKEGDRVVVSVKNTNQTIADLLRSFFYSLAGNDASQIAAQDSGIVTVNGNR